MNPIRVLLADDHTVMRNGLRLLLERLPSLVVVGEASDGRETVRLAQSVAPQVVIRALKAGARACLLKDSAEGDLIAANRS